MEIRKLQKLKDHPDLRRGQKIRLLVDFYGVSAIDDERRIVHRKGDIGFIDGFGTISGQEVVAVEICHHEEGICVVIPVLPSDLEKVSDQTPVTQPGQAKPTSGDLLQALADERPVIVLDILGLPGDRSMQDED